MVNAKNILVFVIVIFTALLSCNTTDPPVDKAELLLKLEDVSCTEAWITLSTNNLQLPTTIELKQDNQTRNIINLVKPDTLLYIDSLLPSKNYKFHSVIQSSNQTSNELNVTTMDTTSHNFTWQSWTFGEVGSSVLYDVAVIDENNIWAVGVIYMKDSLGQPDPLPYNTIHWNGSEWQLKRIFFPTVCGSSNVTSYPAKAIFAFNNDEVWITSSGDKIAILKNSVQTDKFCLPSNVSMSINKIWGTGSNDLYVVGNNGNIAHYNGSQWIKIESGTDLNINDIYGDYNEKTGEWEILAVASNKFFNEGNTLLMIEDSESRHLNNTGLPWSISSSWHISNRKYLIGGDGLFFNKMLNENWEKDTTFIPIYKDRIRGNNINDIVVSGSNGLLSHYNGINWKHFINNELPFYSGRLLSVDIKNDVIIAVGWKETESIITIGIR